MGLLVRFQNSPPFLWRDISTDTAKLIAAPSFKIRQKAVFWTYLWKLCLKFKYLGGRLLQQWLTDIWEPALPGDMWSTTAVCHSVENVINLYSLKLTTTGSPVTSALHVSPGGSDEDTEQHADCWNTDGAKQGLTMSKDHWNWCAFTN